MNPKEYKDIVYQIIGAAMKVHSELNWGLLEPIYNEAMHLELLDRGVENKTEQPLPCYYKHHLMEKHYQMDMVVDDVIVEFKSTNKLISILALNDYKANAMPTLKKPTTAFSSTKT